MNPSVVQSPVVQKPLLTRSLRYGIGLALLALVLYNSVYIRRLDALKMGGSAGSTFNADRYARQFWTTKLLPTAPAQATEMSVLLKELATDKDRAFATHSHAMGIGNIRYFLVKGSGTVTAADGDAVTVTLSTGETLQLATEYIFGNAARDASGLIRITEFDNTTNLNNVSASLNDLIRRQVVPLLKTQARPGAPVQFIGALELNQAHLHLANPTLIPIQVAFVKG